MLQRSKPQRGILLPDYSTKNYVYSCIRRVKTSSCHRKLDRVKVTLNVSSVSISVRWKDCHLHCMSHLSSSLGLLLGVIQRQVEASEVKLMYRQVNCEEALAH